MMYMMEKTDTRYASDEEIRAYIRERKRRNAFKRRCIAAMITALFVIILGLVGGFLTGRAAYRSITKEPVSVAEQVPVVDVAVSQLGNTGGEPYWSWYPFDYRVEWCACFTSWCEDQCGYLESGAAPKFAMVGDGASWFEAKDQWVEGGSTPSAGDLIFFDWDRDGNLDHVGIVSAVIDDKVFTVEGNSSDMCRMKRYKIDDPFISGYGHIVP